MSTIFSFILLGATQLLVIVYPPVLVFWLLLHSTIRHWRRMGIGASWIACLVWPLMGIPGFYFWNEIFAVRWPSPWWMQVLGAGILASGIALFRAAMRVIPGKTLVGVPELDPAHNVQPVLDTGIYARTRNPIYLAHALFILSAALLSGYAANWALLLLDMLVMPLMVRTEERELLDRLGAPYAAYLRRVPRFLL